MAQGKNESLKRLTLIIWASVGGIILFWVFLQLMGRIQIVWVSLVLCFGMVVILEPLVNKFIGWGLKRVWAVSLAFAATALILILVGLSVVPIVRDQGTEFVGEIPTIVDKTIDWIADAADRFGIELDESFREFDIQEWVNDPENRESLQGIIDWGVVGAGAVVKGVFEAVTVAMLFPVLAFYLLVDLERTRKMFYGLIPQAHRAEVEYVSSHLGKALGGFVRGQLFVALIVGILGSIAMFALGLPFWLIIGMTSGVLNLIPFVGPIAGAILAGLIGLLQGEIAKALIAVALFTGIQQLDNDIITPLVQRTRVRLSPMVIIIVLIAGGSLGGFLGVLIAVPATAAVRVIVGHLWRTRILGESWAEAAEASIEVTEPLELSIPKRRKEGHEGGDEETVKTGDSS